jgi:hypothetical protein
VRYHRVALIFNLQGADHVNELISKSILTAGALAAFAVAAMPLAASAGEVHNRVNNQQARINQGVRSGQLTQGEYVRDQNHLDRINAQRRYDLRQNGGHLTPGERGQLNRELNRNSERVYFTKHDRAKQ